EERASVPAEVFGRTSRLRIILVVVVCTELLILTWMPAERRHAQGVFASAKHRLEAWCLSRRDPPPGHLIRIGNYGVKHWVPGPAGIIVISDCEGCSLQAIRDLAARLRLQNT